MILNVHKRGDETEVVPEDTSIAVSLPITIPKSNLLMAGEEIDSELAFRISGIPAGAPVDHFVSPTFDEEGGS